jgi:uncharacterized protein YdhG (YjbR/CyaY superfamily)
MAERKAAKQAAKRTAAKAGKRAGSAGKAAERFTAEERAAMRERARELKAGARDEGDESGVLARIAAMPPSDRTLGERIHAIVMRSAPDLAPRLWYGMPAYAKDGKVVCFFQDAHKFKSRYATLGFSDKAALDDGRMWPTSFALTELTADDEARIGALVKRAVGG